MLGIRQIADVGRRRVPRRALSWSFARDNNGAGDEEAYGGDGGDGEPDVSATGHGVGGAVVGGV